ncbi:MAG TPA: tRNA guanosine(34) transglycosylase Tgt [Rhizomicrobium sp.]|jgi:queuine tRNA-ribosyltransferase|nr:tRNA guanosine(34) transglycosylase Tgt [Rhizomicrobium sp.]
MNTLELEIAATDGAARTGIIKTPRGDIRTPAFMPVGTAGTVKAMLPQSVRETGADIILGNTYHLMLRPGAERVARLGGLHKFSGWERPILTDSGGFQVMSLSKLRKITEEGVKFRSHIDGSEQFLSPERAMEIQRLLGSDIQMVLDECPAYPATRGDIEKSLALSMRWAARSKAAFGEQPGRACFGIVQGGVFADLRQRSAEALQEIGFDGYAIGGLAVGEEQSAMFETLDATVQHLPTGRPRYLMGVGKPDDIAGAVLRGVDMFDCVLPTRSGRNGQAFTRLGVLNLKNARHADDSAPLDDSCACPACRQFSRAYLHHLVKANEILASMLLTWHNLQYFQGMMAALRDGIAQGRVGAVAAEVFAAYPRKPRENGAENLD